MKSIKVIALAAFVTLGVFFAAVFSACSKNECGAVTCFNKSSCSSGVCTCIIKGSYGNGCKNIYSFDYAGAYKGIPPDDPASDTTTLLYLASEQDSTNFDLMRITWVDTSGASVFDFALELNNNSSAGSNFSITPSTKGILTYTGFGSVNGKELSMAIRQVDTAGVVVMRYFNNYIKQ